MAVRPCIDCRRLIDSGSYCSECAWRKNASYSPERPRGRAWMKRRTAVMRRAGDVCEHCRNRLAEEVHHLNSVDDNRLESLLAVCRDCHTALEAEKRAASRG